MQNSLFAFALTCCALTNASAIDYFFANQDDGLLATEVPKFDDNGMTAGDPEEVTLFEWTAKKTGLTQAIVNVAALQKSNSLAFSRTFRVILLNSTTGAELCSAAFESSIDILSPDFNTVGCAFTGIIPYGETLMVQATSTDGATLDPTTEDPFHPGFRLGLGANFNVI